jgi:hypothetical protein
MLLAVTAGASAGLRSADAMFCAGFFSPRLGERGEGRPNLALEAPAEPPKLRHSLAVGAHGGRKLVGAEHDQRYVR